MPVSDALVVGGEWLSEHYFTSDATKKSFLARARDRRAIWDQLDADPAVGTSTRSRFLAARSDLEQMFTRIDEAVTGGAADVDDLGSLHRLLFHVLGYDAGEYAAETEGPITRIVPTTPGVDGSAVLLRARPAPTVDDLLDRMAPTLAESWEPEDLDPVLSVATALSTLLTEPKGPRYALVLSAPWCLVSDRDRWPEGRWLAVDLRTVVGRNERTKGGEIDRALTVLDAASLVPDTEGDLWWEDTTAESIQHTVGVSRDLREGVRLSIETIANEVVARRRDQGLEPLPPEAAQPLAVQSLRYLYRVLFLLYAEASPELGVLPAGVADYDAGYGLDRLRELTLRDVHTPHAQQGTHLYDSLATLFRVVDAGHTPEANADLREGLTFGAMRADLFAPAATALIDEVGLGNAKLLDVLRRLMLSKEKGGAQRGFVSYVELGINQLGAVYEGLMSYTGSFATEDLYEVAPGGNPEKGSWVVPTTRADHLDPGDFVRHEDPRTGEQRRVLHRQGTFVFRLSGRDRQRSASYYTPEVLTRFTVQQALAELLDQDDRVTSAEEILGLSVCEPALGSGAFAIEAVRQLAEQYLSRRETELGERVDPEQRARELQKIKAHIALHQVYGVDLNRTAVELAEISLWLDTMVEGLDAPWFGLRLRRGNSLVGARRSTYAAASVKNKNWMTETARDEPVAALAEQVDGGATALPAGRVHHFLLPATGWGSSLEVPKTVRDLVPTETLTALKQWRSAVRRKPTAKQLKTLDGLARRTEVLWATTLRRLRLAEQQSGRRIDLWGREPHPQGAVTREQIEKSLADPNGSYRRLRLVMDAWCALWFWPLTEPDIAPPTLDQWLDAVTGILGDHRVDTKREWMQTFGDAVDWDQLGVAEQQELAFAGVRPVESVVADHPWLGVCRRVAEQQGFFHWELDFAAVFARGGFDLQVGNPPWVRPDVKVDDLLADGDPWWALALKAGERQRSARRPETLALPGMQRSVIDGATETAVLGDYLADTSNYPFHGGRPDLYRSFMSQVWRHGSAKAMSALIHLESHFTDEKAVTLRRATYRHLRRHWQFINELRLFEIQDQKRYGVNVYGADREPAFLHATTLYHPDTVVRSLGRDMSGPEPGFKDDEGNWDQRPHGSRIQRVDGAALRLWADVIGSDDVWSTPMVYTVNAAAVRTLEALAAAPRMKSLGLEFSAGWNEKTDREKGRFVQEWGPAAWEDAILQGGHLYVSTPLYKSPNSTMKHHLDWTANDLEALPADAQPVTAYKPAGDRGTYDRAYTHWGENRDPARDHYRVAWRAMAANTGERTLISALIPPGTAHVHGVAAATVATDPLSTVEAAAAMSTLLADFAIRSAPKSGIPLSAVNRLPRLDRANPLFQRVILRALRLNCVTDAYADLWEDCWREEFANDRPILPRHDERPVKPTWTPDVPLRRALDRRNAQIEIDVMVAIMLGVPVEDLGTIYRTQFAVLRGYDQREYTFDSNGRLVPNSVLVIQRKSGERILMEECTAPHPGSGSIYSFAPSFRTFDRVLDFGSAYAALLER